MAASQKAIENANRLRYIRALERFHKSILSYFLNAQDVSFEGFVKKVDNAAKLLDRVEVINLYKGDYKDLEQLVKRIFELKSSAEDIDDIKDEIVHNSNLLDKSKNAKKYKKDKHMNSKYKDWE